MGACSSEAKDQTTNTGNPSTSAVRISDARRHSQASVAYSQSNRKVSQSGVVDIQSESGIKRRRSSVSFRQPLVTSKWENGDGFNAPVYAAEPLVDSMVAYQDISGHNPGEIIVAGDNAFNTKIMAEPTDVSLSHLQPAFEAIEPALEANIESQTNVVQMEPVIVNSSALPYSGYQVDDNGVVMKSPDQTIVAELHGNKVFDPLIGEMVYVLDENAPVDGLEIIPATEINARSPVLSN